MCLGVGRGMSLCWGGVGGWGREGKGEREGGGREGGKESWHVSVGGGADGEGGGVQAAPCLARLLVPTIKLQQTSNA